MNHGSKASPPAPVPSTRRWTQQRPPYLSNRPADSLRHRPRLLTSEPRVLEDGLVGLIIASRYLIQRPLPPSVTGECYAGTQLDNGAQVAVRIVEPERHGKRPQVADLLRRARQCAQLQHSNIVPVLDYGWEQRGWGEVSFVVEPLLGGPTLRSLLTWEGPTTVRRALEIALDVARALGAAHRQGLTHLQLNPQNILLPPGGKTGTARISGFAGLAPGRAPREGLPTGTRQLAPEQLCGAEPDPTADVYALGASLYEMLTGRPPFETRRTFQVLLGRPREALPPLRGRDGEPLPSAICALVESCLQHDPGERPADARPVQGVLEGLLDNLGA